MSFEAHDSFENVPPVLLGYGYKCCTVHVLYEHDHMHSHSSNLGPFYYVLPLSLTGKFRSEVSYSPKFEFLIFIVAFVVADDFTATVTRMMKEVPQAEIGVVIDRRPVYVRTQRLVPKTCTLKDRLVIPNKHIVYNKLIDRFYEMFMKGLDGVLVTSKVCPTMIEVGTMIKFVIK